MKNLTFVLMLFLVSCGLEPRQHAAPEDVIPQDSMVIILHDLSILESYIHQKYVQLERYALLMRMSGDSLLQDFGVSRERYEASMDYYGKNPKLFMQIYDSVLFKLEGGQVNVNPYEAKEHGF